MRLGHSVAQVRAAERALMAVLPDGALMRRAAAGLAACCAGLLGQVYGARVVVLAGSGDNGGDALYAGAALAGRGAVVTAVTTGARVHAAGLAALRAAGGTVTGAEDPAAGPAIVAAGLIIDGLLGIGGSGGIRAPGASLAAAAARAGGTVVAVDLPSGVDADTGAVQGVAVRADVTVTFGTLKPGLLIDPGAALAGSVRLIDIGLRPYLGEPDVAAAEAADVAAWLPVPGPESDKYRRGVLGIAAGSDRFTGAATLAVGGAVHGGAGLIRLICPEPAAAVARQHWPEAVITVAAAGHAAAAADQAGQVQAWLAGPGMGTGDDAAALLAAILRTSLPVLVDADGLTVLGRNRDLLPRAAPTLITPHAGELARLTGADRAQIESQRLRHARQAAAELGVTVLLKGSTTVVAGPDQDATALVNCTGTSWLATAGSGDVLSGLAGALLAQGAGPEHAAAAAAYLHGLAGQFAADGAPIGATDLISALPAAFRAVR